MYKQICYVNLSAFDFQGDKVKLFVPAPTCVLQNIL